MTADLNGPTETISSSTRWLGSPEHQSVAGLVAAGAMTALLSGDVRLAVRATRLLMSDDEAGPRKRTLNAGRGPRVWRRPTLRSRR